MGNSFGTLFRISTWGESHGGGIGVVVDGCPPRLPLDIKDIQFELDRRRPGQSDITTPRKESDTATIVSGVYEGMTLGTPIGIYVPNGDQRPSAYSEMKDKFRPSHADFTYQTKFGIRNHEGGGRSSARETIGRVAAGAIAKKILKLAGDIDVRAYITRVHDIETTISEFPTLEQVEANP
ncbi:MAG: chorismate synthase, partial [Coraliomargarita sp.]